MSIMRYGLLIHHSQQCYTELVFKIFQKLFSKYISICFHALKILLQQQFVHKKLAKLAILARYNLISQSF